MPGPGSDSYDPEFGTAGTVYELHAVLKQVYADVSSALDDQPPLPIFELLRRDDLKESEITVQFSEWELRIIRFALERAMDTI